jgi:hypothetical protein
MAKATPAHRLANYEQRYRELAQQLAEIGLISSGTVTRRYTHCATPGCKCKGDSPQPHGPYYQWTRKVNGKTVTRRLSAAEAKLYKVGSITIARCAGSSHRCVRWQARLARSGSPRRWGTNPRA